MKGHDGQGKTNVSAEQEAPRQSTRVSGSDGHQERAPGAQAPAGKGPETPHGQQRIERRQVGQVGHTGRVSLVGRDDRADREKGSARFRRDEHIRQRADFQQVYKSGFRLNGRFSTIFLLPNNHGVGRLGIAATKKLGGAVQRNRAKRLIREVFRHNKIAPGSDVVVVPRRGLLETSLTILEADYLSTLERRLRQRR
jgi:ribonuclease P protein component